MHSLQCTNKEKGVTLIELLIVIVIAVVLLIVLIPIGLNFYRIQILNSANDQVISLLKQARSNALSLHNQSDYGVFFANNQLVLFEGSDYQSRNQSLDLIISVPAIVSLSGESEIVFAKGLAEPNNPGSIILQAGSRSKEININPVGLISF